MSDLKEALADVLLVDGNPMDDIELLGDPDKNLVIIMKDGKIYKNTLGQTPEQKKKALIDRSIKRAALSPGRVNQPTKTGNAFYFCAIHQAYHFMDGKLPFAGL